jgi:hypothetical protein
MHAETLSLKQGLASLAVSLALLVAATGALAAPAKMPARPMAKHAAAKHAMAGAQLCNGTFSNGVTVNVPKPVYMPDVGWQPPAPGLTAATQTVCDVHTFAWNQFLYYTQMSADPNNGNMVTPAFLHMAPWYNALTVGPKPGAYPGGATDLRTAFLDQGQAGTDGHLLDVANQTVRYDIRFDVNMYDSIVLQNFYTAPQFTAACQPDPNNNGTCKNNLKLWMTPSGANEHPEPGSIEIKTSWRDFGTPASCPASQFYCNGRFGLVGLHYVNKTFSHGEWIWASFEHVANAPGCAPGSDSPIAPQSPIGSAWSFFNPATAGSGVMSSKTCNVTSSPPQCNANPNPTGKAWVPVNVCRTDSIAAGGASSANCTVGTTANNAGNVACLNASIQPQLSGVWKNYKLIGAVWTAGGMGPNQDFRIQIFQSQVPGIPYAAPAGFTHLADTTMETWLQMGSTGYDPFKTNASQAGCFLCHNQPSAFAPHNKEVDLSHFPGKLPLLKLTALRNSLVKANSTVKAPK